MAKETIRLTPQERKVALACAGPDNYWKALQNVAIDRNRIIASDGTILAVRNLIHPTAAEVHIPGKYLLNPEWDMVRIDKGEFDEDSFSITGEIPRVSSKPYFKWRQLFADTRAKPARIHICFNAKLLARFLEALDVNYVHLEIRGYTDPVLAYSCNDSGIAGAIMPAHDGYNPIDGVYGPDTESPSPMIDGIVAEYQKEQANQSPESKGGDVQ
jgi:hypothetical protein